MPEAMQQIRTKLGKDAVILQSKKVKTGGFLGLFKKDQVEVIAALDTKPVQQQNIDERATKTESTIFEKSHPQVKEQQDIVLEIKHLRKLLEQKNEHQEFNFNKSYQVLYDYLISQEIEQSIAKELITMLEKKYQDRSTVSIDTLIQNIRQWIEYRLEGLSFSGINPGTRIVQLIGPTGVGKTTTIAKLAAKTMMEMNKTVAFITTDTYRIAAIEQLKTYARILEVPIEVAYSLEDYKRAVDKLSSVDLIFVDTAGRNFRQSNYVDELTEYIEAKEQTEVFLVMALTAKYEDALFAFEQFSHIRHKKLIFTKVDETRQYGSLLNLSLKPGVDIAFLTNGQDVPHDIMTPSAKRISRLIMSEYYDE